MATFLLVHGMWHGAWCWDALVDTIGKRGHRAKALAFPGMDGSNDDVRRASLEAWTEVVVRAARAEAAPPILVGHSRGGLVVSQAAERDPAAFRALVYVSAVLLPNGATVADIAADLPPDGVAGIVPSEDGLSTTLRRDVAAAIMYQKTELAVREAALDRMQSDPAGIFVTPLAVSESRFGRLPRYYIECLQDLTIPIDIQRRMQATYPADTVATLDCDHSPMASCPEELADALIRFASDHPSAC